MNVPIQPDKNTAIVNQVGIQSPILIDWFTRFTAYVKSLVVSTRKINTTAPLTGGGDLSADLTLSLTGLTVVINTAKLTGGGATGTMTFTNGVLTAQVQAT